MVAAQVVLSWILSENIKTLCLYILIFTCFNVRTIHLELVNDISTHSVSLVMIRFFNIYCVSSCIYSDIVWSFVARCNLIKQVHTLGEFEDKFSTFNIKHLTIPMYSAWFESVWECLIKTVKCCLYKLVVWQKLLYFEFLTVSSDTQNAVNSHSITYQCSGDAGLDIISLNVFIQLHYSSAIFINSNESFFEEALSARCDLLKNLDHRDLLLQRFKCLWHEEYLLGLRELTHDLYQYNFNNVIKVDNVVLIKNPIKSHPYWSLGKVIKVTPGDNTCIRLVLIKKSDSTTQEHSLKLSIIHLHQALDCHRDHGFGESSWNFCWYDCWNPSPCPECQTL